MKIEEISKYIKEYVDYQNKANDIREILDKNLEIFEKETIKTIEEKFLEKFNKKPFVSMYENFFSEEPVVFYIKSLDGAYLKDDGTFISYKKDLDKNIIDWEEEIVDIGISQKEITDFIEELSKELDITIELYFEKTLTKEDIDVIRDYRDIKILYPESNILQKGEVYYKGWDIPDHWVIYELEGNHFITWSENGHGFGMDYEICSPFRIEKINEFLDFVNEDENNEFINEWIFNNLKIVES